MIILEKTDGILSYTINPDYFDEFNEVESLTSARSYWQTAPAGAYVFTYRLSFTAAHMGGGRQFIGYQSRLTCTVRIEDADSDAAQILSFVKNLYEAMREFITNNSLTYTNKLNLPKYEVTDIGLANMRAAINGLKDMKRYEDKSARELQIEKDIFNTDIKTVVTKIKN